MKKKAKSSYWEKLKDPRWQKKRLEVMQRADFKCEDCGDGGSTLNVHHRAYKKNSDPWDYEEEALMCLCESCHEEDHRIGALLDNALYRYKTESCGLGLTKEQLLGFLEGEFWGAGPDDEWIEIRSYEHAIGIAKSAGIDIKSGTDWLIEAANRCGGRVHSMEYRFTFQRDSIVKYYREKEEKSPGFIRGVFDRYFGEWPEAVMRQLTVEFKDVLLKTVHQNDNPVER